MLERLKRLAAHPYLRFLLLLLCIFTGMLLGLSVLGCGGIGSDEPNCGCKCPYTQKLVPVKSSVYNQKTNPALNAWEPGIQGGAYAVAGGRASRTFLIYGAQAGSQVTWKWTPPPGASNFNFPSNRQPEPGGPPFIFRDVPANEEFSLHFDVPELSQGEEARSVSEYAEILLPDGSLRAAAFDSTINANNPLRLSQSPAAPARYSGQSQAWDVQRQFYTDGITLTTDMITGALQTLQSPDAFLALRFPVTTPVTQSYALPVIFEPGRQPLLKLVQYVETSPGFYTPVPLVTGTVEYRPERLTYLQNTLPSVPGEHWLALGVQITPALSVPEGLAIEPGSWDVWGELAIEVPQEVSSLPVYLCAQGAASTLRTALAAGRLLGRLPAELDGVNAVQAQGITCAGPLGMNLYEENDASLTLHGGGGLITYTQPVSLMHYIVLNPYSPGMQVQFDLHSELDAGWKLYRDNGSQAPDPNQPIEGPVDPNDSFLFFWVTGTPPLGAAPGAYPLWLTASLTTQPTVTQTIIDPLWLAEWTPPPPEPLPGEPLLIGPANGALSAAAQVTLTWQAGPGAFQTGFNLAWDGVVITTSNTYSSTWLAPGAHTWKVRAYSPVGASPWSPQYTLYYGSAPQRKFYLPLALRSQ